ncbi:hypothetical protein Trydic_g17017 [Trypoxylus dichotomus]
MTTIRYWFNKLKLGRTSVIAEERSGRLIDDKVHDIVLTDHWLKTREATNVVNISRVQNMLHEKLSMRKLPVQCELRLLTIGQKRNHVITSTQCLYMFKHKLSELVRLYITWIHHYTQESNG